MFRSSALDGDTASASGSPKRR